MSAIDNPRDRKSTRLNSSHTEIYTLSLHDALPISRLYLVDHGANGQLHEGIGPQERRQQIAHVRDRQSKRSEEHTSELQSHRDLHSFPTRRSSDLAALSCRPWRQWAIARRHRPTGTPTADSPCPRSTIQ